MKTHKHSSRREFLRTTSNALSAAALLPSASIKTDASLSAAEKSRPNIVWILVENIGPELGCYGYSLVKTPNIDRLASEGTRYTRVFSTSSVCAPSRAAMMTGAYQIKSNTQHLRMNPQRYLPEPFRPFTHYLRQVGYYTALGCGYSAKTDINFRPREGSFHGFDGRDWSNRKPGQPFFAQITLHGTHRGEHWYGYETFNVRYSDAVRAVPHVCADDVTLPPYMPDHPVSRDDWARYLTQIQRIDFQVGEILERLEDEGEIENTVIILMADNGRDHFRCMDWLYDGGIHVPMIVRLPGKDKAGTVCEDLISTLDITATVLAVAGVERPDHMDGIPFLGSNVTKRECIFAARDRIDEVLDRIRCVRTRRYKYIRNFMPEKGYRQKRWAVENNPVVRIALEIHRHNRLSAEQALIMAETKPREELYDLQTDPNEFHNLSDSPAHADILNRMRHYLDEWISATGDTGQYREKREDALETPPWFVYDVVYGACRSGL